MGASYAAGDSVLKGRESNYRSSVCLKGQCFDFKLLFVALPLRQLSTALAELFRDARKCSGEEDQGARVAPRTAQCYNMCMHINKRSVDRFIDSIAEIDEQELDRLQAAIDRRRGFLKMEKKLSTVLERREYRNGLLQLEGRAYRRKKDGELTERGPYWYFHYREGGKQRTLYVGKTENPEAKVNEIMKGEE